MENREWYINKTEEIATERAKKLQKRLNKSTGGKWQISVHENMGWHYNVYIGSLSLYEYGKENYSTLMSDRKDHHGSGSGIWKYRNTSKTPEEAIQWQLQEAYNVSKEIMNAVVDTMSKLPKVEIK